MALLKLLSAKTRQRRHSLAEQARSDLERTTALDELQLSKLNYLWSEAISQAPYYRELVQNGVPKEFESLDTFAASVPVFGKKQLQVHGVDAFKPLREGAYSWSSTGGSTAEPVKFPRFSSEIEIHEAVEWYMRSLVGITPDDPYFRLWGHSHILGKGPKRWLRILQRKLKDAALGMVRISAYDLSSVAVQKGLQALVRSRSRYVLGYSKALEVYAEAILKEKSFRLPALKGIIATAEGFTSKDARDRVEAAFGCRVFMEYGSMETGPIAQETKEGGYQVAWNKYLLEAVPTDEGQHKLLVTALYPRAFPLFRYDLGDLVSGFDKALGITRFGAIVGRSNPNVVLRNGTSLHCGAITHCLKVSSLVKSFQIGLSGNRLEKIFVIPSSTERLHLEVTDIRYRMAQVDDQLSKIPIEIINEPLLTPAGKRPTFIQLQSQILDNER